MDFFCNNSLLFVVDFSAALYESFSPASIASASALPSALELNSLSSSFSTLLSSAFQNSASMSSLISPSETQSNIDTTVIDSWPNSGYYTDLALVPSASVHCYPAPGPSVTAVPAFSIMPSASLYDGNCWFVAPSYYNSHAASPHTSIMASAYESLEILPSNSAAEYSDILPSASLSTTSAVFPQSPASASGNPPDSSILSPSLYLQDSYASVATQSLVTTFTHSSPTYQIQSDIQIVSSSMHGGDDALTASHGFVGYDTNALQDSSSYIWDLSPSQSILHESFEPSISMFSSIHLESESMLPFTYSSIAWHDPSYVMWDISPSQSVIQESIDPSLRMLSSNPSESETMSLLSSSIAWTDLSHVASLSPLDFVPTETTSFVQQSTSLTAGKSMCWIIY